MNKNIYEIGLLINPDLSQQEVEQTVGKIKDILTKDNASVISEGEIVRIDLAYQIITKISSKNERFDEANFTWVKFESETSAMESIKKEIDKIKKEVFRYLITKTTADDEATNKFNSEENNEDENSELEEDELKIEVENVEEGDTSKTEDVEEKKD